MILRLLDPQLRSYEILTARLAVDQFFFFCLLVHLSIVCRGYLLPPFQIILPLLRPPPF